MSRRASKGGPRAPSLCAAFVALAASACVPGAEDEGVRRVILITCDTLRADRLGAYGYDGGTSPHLDALARECLVFDAAWSSSPYTVPAVATIMTGRTPDELEMVSNMRILPAEAMTVAEALAGAGIETAAVVSNWVLQRRGRVAGTGIQQGFDHYDDRTPDADPNRPAIRERVASKTTDAALAWLDGEHDDRYFLWVHYQDPHGPYTPPEELVRPVAVGAEPALTLEVGESHTGRGEIPRYQVVDGERDPSAYLARYDGEIRYFDRELGRLVEGLRERGALDGALLLFTADHGESLGEHGYWFSHGQTLHRELVHVPFLVRYPDGAPRPAAVARDGLARVAAPVGHVDVCATVLDAFGLPPLPTHGRSLLASELDPERVVPQSLRGQNDPDRWAAISDGRYRAVRSPAGVALYDLATDPGELRDLSAEEGARVERMLERLDRELSRLPPLESSPAAESELDDEEWETLRSLGYAGD